VGNWLIDQVDSITNRRIENARWYDEAFAGMGDSVGVPARRPDVKHVYHLYILRVERRDELLRYLQSEGIEAKIHYPIPIHLQPASKDLGYGKGDFPVCEKDCGCVITLPVHQHLTEEEMSFTIDRVKTFYGAK
jgi:dTDP-4-amino-4,6-dideoxygalactose transaminase